MKQPDLRCNPNAGERRECERCGAVSASDVNDKGAELVSLPRVFALVHRLGSGCLFQIAGFGRLRSLIRSRQQERGGFTQDGIRTDDALADILA